MIKFNDISTMDPRAPMNPPKDFEEWLYGSNYNKHSTK